MAFPAGAAGTAGFLAVLVVLAKVLLKSKLPVYLKVPKNQF